MRELLPDLENWLNADERVALATVISTWGSAPRPAGSAMAVSEHGGIVGSVSGGCVEGAVIQAAQEVLKSQRPQRLHFGVADETAWDVGLACGGKIDVFVQPMHDGVIRPLIERLKDDKTSILSTVIMGPEGVIGLQNLADEKGKVLASSDGLIALPELATYPHIISGNNTEVFVNPLRAPPTL